MNRSKAVELVAAGGKAQEPPTTLELVGNIACLVVVMAIVSFGLYETAKISHVQFDNFPVRSLTPEHLESWD